MTTLRHSQSIANFSHVLLILISLLLLPNRAYACSCAFAPAKTESERLRENLASEYVGAVFVGEVQQARLENPDAQITSGADPVYVTFDVDQVSQGEIAHQFTLTTFNDQTSLPLTPAPHAPQGRLVK